MNRHHKSRRVAALVACVGTTAAIAALGAGAAQAAVTCRSPGYATGSSLQSAAMEKVWLTATGWEKNTSCSSPAKITYTKSGSGPGLEEFGNNSGELQPEEDPTAFKSTEGTKDVGGQVLDWFVGTDDPPTAGQLSEAEAAAGAKNLAEITIPVAQSPVAADLSLPTGCLIPSGSKVNINNTTLPQLWEGTKAASGKDPGGIQAQGGYAIGTWGALLTQLGYTKTATNPPTVEKTFFDDGTEAGCSALIKGQVRSIGSGTSYAWKNYFAQINFSVWSTFANDAVSWPVTEITEDPLTKGPGNQTNETGGKIAANTAANPGSVGYSNPADASANGGFTHSATTSKFGTGGGESAAHQILWAQIQDNGKEVAGAEYADPAVEGQEVANCETTKLVPSDKGFPYSYTDSWFGIVATDPNIAKDAGAGDYSVCALTYDLVWHHYSNVNLYGKTEVAHEVANTTKDLFEYIIGQGQTDIQSHYYSRFPSGFQTHVAQAVNPGIGF